MRVTLATHTVWKSTDKLDPFTVSFFRTLIGKSGHYVTERQSDTLRTFALCRDFPQFPDVTATAGEIETQRASEGMAYSDDETDHRPSNED